MNHAVLDQLGMLNIELFRLSSSRDYLLTNPEPPRERPKGIAVHTRAFGRVRGSHAR